MAESLTTSRINQFKDLARKTMRPLLDAVSAVEERQRLAIEKKVAREMGIDAQKKKIDELSQELEHAQEELVRVIGKAQSYYGVKNNSYNGIPYDLNSPFGKEVQARLSGATGDLQTIRSLEEEIDSAITLSDAPGEICKLLQGLPARVQEFMPLIEKQLKRLPAPKTE